MRMWHVLLVGAAALIGCGIFLALQNLGAANDYATIASFFLALVIAIGSALSFVRAKSGKESARHDENNHGHGTILNLLNKLVVVGNNSHIRATFKETPSSATGHRKFGPTDRR